MKKIICGIMFSVLLSLFFSVGAVPVLYYPYNLEQPSGEAFTCYPYGDENGSGFRCGEYEVEYNSEDGYYYYVAYGIGYKLYSPTSGGVYPSICFDKYDPQNPKFTAFMETYPDAKGKYVRTITPWRFLIDIPDVVCRGESNIFVTDEEKTNIKTMNIQAQLKVENNDSSETPNSPESDHEFLMPGVLAYMENPTASSNNNRAAYICHFNGKHNGRIVNSNNNVFSDVFDSEKEDILPLSDDIKKEMADLSDNDAAVSENDNVILTVESENAKDISVSYNDSAEKISQTVTSSPKPKQWSFLAFIIIPAAIAAVFIILIIRKKKTI